MPLPTAPTTLIRAAVKAVLDADADVETPVELAGTDPIKPVEPVDGGPTPIPPSTARVLIYLPGHAAADEPDAEIGPGLQRIEARLVTEVVLDVPVDSPVDVLSDRADLLGWPVERSLRREGARGPAHLLGGAAQSLSFVSAETQIILSAQRPVAAMSIEWIVIYVVNADTVLQSFDGVDIETWVTPRPLQDPGDPEPPGPHARDEFET